MEFPFAVTFVTLSRPAARPNWLPCAVMPLAFTRPSTKLTPEALSCRTRHPATPSKSIGTGSTRCRERAKSGLLHSMTRGVEQSPKARRLLSAFVDYLLDHGLDGTSLRPAAAAIGTSARMLLHYFGTKDALLVAAMKEVTARQQSLIGAELARHPEPDPHHHMLAFWRSYAPKHRRNFLLLVFELWMAALRDPKRLPGFLEDLDVYRRLTVDSLVQSGVPRARADASGTVYLAAMRGLVLDLLTTGDRARIETAVARLAALVEADLDATRGRAEDVDPGLSRPHPGASAEPN